MTKTINEEAAATEALRVEVTLNVTHRVTVRLDGNSGQTMEELKQRALDEFHRDPAKHGLYGETRRSDDKWRAQFNNRSNISVSPESVSIASVNTEPDTRRTTWDS